MRNEQDWKPTKYQLVRDSLRSSSDPREVKPGSKLMVERVAQFYDSAIPKYASGRLVDLGCGQAPLYIKYNQYVSLVWIGVAAYTGTTMSMSSAT